MVVESPGDEQEIMESGGLPGGLAEGRELAGHSNLGVRMEIMDAKNRWER